MSLTATLGPERSRLSRGARRLVAAGLALLAAAALVALLGWALTSGGALPVVAPKSPFGTGLREAAPAADGFGGYILAVQSSFYRLLAGALAAIGREGAGAVLSLLGIGFAYGAFHAAGPGHGKGIIAGYLVASRRTLLKGLWLSLAAALLQALVAILLVGCLAVAFRATAATISAAAGLVEMASFAAVAAFGLAILWRRTARLVPDGSPHLCGPDCGHAHAPGAADVARVTTARETAAVIVAAGIRPCSGAILLLVFALSQGAVAAGVAGVVAMALGTALTTGALAALAVFAKTLALRFAAGGGRFGDGFVAALETLAAAAVAVLGLALLAGSWAGGGPS